MSAYSWAAGPGYRVNDTIPDISGITHSGAGASIHDYSGQVIVLHYCALWCGPCQGYASNLAAQLSTLDSTVGAENYEVLEMLLFGWDYLVADIVDAQAWRSLTGPNVTVLHGNANPASQVNQSFFDFGLDGTPSFVVVAPNLRVQQIDKTSGANFNLVSAVESVWSEFSTPGPPAAVADLYYATPGVQLDVGASEGVLANDVSYNGDVITAVLIDTTTDGPLTLNADGSFSYLPAGDFSGDSFTYQASDVDGNSATVTVTLDPGDAVIAIDDFYDIPGNALYDLALKDGPDGIFDDLFDNDVAPGGGALVVDAIAGADAVFGPADGVTMVMTEHGQVRSGPNGRFLYIPDMDYLGPDSFQYRLKRDGGTSTDTATVHLQVTARPTLSYFSWNIIPGETNYIFEPLLLEALSFYFEFPDTFYIAANPSGNPVELFVIQPPSQGELEFNPDGTFVYTPEPGFEASGGTVFFWIQGTDGIGVSDPQRVILFPSNVVYGRNDTYATPAETTLNVPAGSGVLINDEDPDMDPIEVIGYGVNDLYESPGQPLALPSGATLTIQTDGSLTYEPPSPAGPAFTELFFYDVDIVGGNIDGYGSAAVTINVDGTPNLPPSAKTGGPYSVQAGGSIFLNGNTSSDPDLDELSFSWSVSVGSLDDETAAMPQFTAPGSATQVELSLTVSDGNGGESSASTQILVFDPIVAQPLFHNGFETPQLP